MNHLLSASLHLPVVLAVTIPVETLMLMGGAAVVVITAFTFSNWRMGVKMR